MTFIITIIIIIYITTYNHPLNITDNQKQKKY